MTPEKAKNHAGLPLHTAAQCQQLDQFCIQDLGMDGFELMQQAAQSAFAVLLSQWPHVSELIIVCGKGNNGGDGFEMAALAVEHEMSVQLVFEGDVTLLKGEAKQAAKRALDSGLSVLSAEQVDWERSNCVIVDALLGTGTKGAPSGVYAELIARMNASGHEVLAVDVPSGLNATTGQCEGVAVRATLTVTMLLNKQGLYTGDAKDYVGEVRLASLGVPKSARHRFAPTSDLVNWQQVKGAIPSRDLTAHKGRFGHVLIIGGDHGMAGAVLLSAQGALRSGAGLVSVATRAEHLSALVARQPEIMAHGVDSGLKIQPLLEKADVIAIGPGLGQSSWGQQMLQQVMLSDKPLVLDADALNLLAQQRIAHNLAKRISVMTPHPGEAARLLRVSTHDIARDRFASIKQLSEQFHSHVVLKGAGTLIGDDEHISICTDGNPGMASGGMGDVLTGILVGLMAQAKTDLPTQLHEVVSCGVCLHSACADEAAKHGMNSLLASDLLVELRQMLN
ncbi:MAG: NAD(P)H-hydrate dehydratase [Gammaproteobacteria bacterium]|nr:NAD(P)H-hydrate dehydratase [Gammaproteobacteria bacterium]